MKYLRENNFERYVYTIRELKMNDIGPKLPVPSYKQGKKKHEQTLPYPKPNHKPPKPNNHQTNPHKNKTQKNMDELTLRFRNANLYPPNPFYQDGKPERK